MGRFPDCFPEDFEKSILPSGAKQQNLDVYRVALHNDTGDPRNSFLSTYEEVLIGMKTDKTLNDLDLFDPGTYSTSCFWKKRSAEKLWKIMKNHHPAALLMKGVTEGTCGVSQITKEREPDKNGHVDWWIYKDSQPQIHFMKVEESNEENLL